MQQIIGMVVILSCLVLSVAAFMQFGGGGLGGLNNLIKPNTMQQASSELRMHNKVWWTSGV